MTSRKWIAALTCLALIATHLPRTVAVAEAQTAEAQVIEDATAPGTASPGEDAGIERWDWEKFWTYAACGAGIALATGGAGVVAAAIACGRVLSLYWTT